MYWQTSLMAVALLAIYVVMAYLINQKFRWITTFNLALISILIALNIILTNIIGYSRFLFGRQVEIGNFLILVIGMMFGPWAGFTSAIVGDLLGSIIFVGGTFHLGFMVSKMSFGILGSLVFTRFLFKWWRIKLLFWCTIAILIQVVIIHPLAMYGTTVEDWPSFWTRFLIAIPGKAIIIAIEGVLYPFCIFISFRLLYSLYIKRSQRFVLWSDRREKISFALPTLNLKWRPKRLVRVFKRTKLPLTESSN